MTRVRRAWQALDRERRNAAVAALALLLTMFLPWFQQNGVVHGAVVSNGLDAFAVFSIIEAIVLLGCLSVLALLFARAEGRPIPLPQKDGSVVLGVGALATLLVFTRLFDKPGVSGNSASAVNVGIEWGIFFALLAAGLLAYSGARLRVASNEPRLLPGREGERRPGGGPRRPAASPPAALPPAALTPGTPARAPARTRAGRGAAARSARASAGGGAGGRGGTSGQGGATGQLSFEDGADQRREPPG